MAAWNEPRGPRVHPRNGHLPSEFATKQTRDSRDVSTIVVRFSSNATEGVEVPCLAQSRLDHGNGNSALREVHFLHYAAEVSDPPGPFFVIPCPFPPRRSTYFPDPYQSFPPWEDDLPYINFLDRARRGEDKDEVPSVPPLSQSKLRRFGPHQSGRYLRDLCFFGH